MNGRRLIGAVATLAAVLGPSAPVAVADDGGEEPSEQGGDVPSGGVDANDPSIRDDESAAVGDRVDDGEPGEAPPETEVPGTGAADETSTATPATPTSSAPTDAGPAATTSEPANPTPPAKDPAPAAPQQPPAEPAPAPTLDGPRAATPPTVHRDRLPSLEAHDVRSVTVATPIRPVRRAVRASSPRPSVSRPSSVVPQAAPRSPDEGAVLVVRSGESLWTVAAATLGPNATNAEIARAVDRLWHLNAGRIASNRPDVIAVGEHLRLR